MQETRVAIAKSLALEAGAILREAYVGSKIVHNKGRIDLLTNFDLESQRLIVEGIQNAYPEDDIISEESTARFDKPDVWLVDPLDGTTNFTHGVPDFTISLAYLRDAEPILGVIYNPARDELFHAEQGNGAFLNKDPIYVSTERFLLNSLLAAGFPYELEQITFDPFSAWSRIFYRSRGIRHIGCASMNLAYIAAGRLDAYWEEGSQPWDLAAGMLVVAEAGGQVSRMDGSPDPIQTPCSVLASNGHLHDEIIELLADFLGPDRGRKSN